MELLNTDIIRHIILSMKDDKASLFRCLLVNKTWCAQTVDILWSQPFRLLYSCASQVNDEFTCTCSFAVRQHQASILISTYISRLFQENEQALINNNLAQQGQIPTSMFDYISYLRSIDIHEMDLAIIDFYHFNQMNFKEKVEESLDNTNEGLGLPGSFFEEITSQTLLDPLTDTTTVITTSVITKIINPDSQETLSETETSPPQLDYAEIIEYLADPKSISELRNTVSEYQIISETLLKFFMGKCKNIRRLSLDVTRTYRKSRFNPCKDFQHYPTALSYRRGFRLNPEYKKAEIYLMMPKYPSAINCLSHIKELICTTKRNTSDFLLVLSEYVHNIDKLEINVDYPVEINSLNIYLSREHAFLRTEVENLIKLIHKQKNLSNFVLHNCPVDFHLIMAELRESQAENLKSLSLVGIKFEDKKILSHLKPFLSLQKLRLTKCTFSQNDIDYATEKLYLPNLTMINLNNSVIPHQFLQCLLQICSSDLEYIDIGKKAVHTEPTFNPIQFISTNFSNIKFLKCGLNSFDNNYLFSLLSYTSDDIRSIILDNSDFESEKNNFAMCLSKLSEINFINLKYFGVRGNLIFSEYTLSNFLRGLKLSTLEFTDNVWFTDAYLKEILNCLDDGFTCDKLMISTYNEIKPELLDKARRKIKVVQYVDKTLNRVRYG